MAHDPIFGIDAAVIQIACHCNVQCISCSKKSPELDGMDVPNSICVASSQKTK